MAAAEPVRVEWYEGQILHRDDFADETAYHRERQRRHLALVHRWGIFAGLELSDGGNDRLIVTPGAAVDGYGRELVLPAPLPIGTQPFVDRDADVLDFWLVWREVEAAATGSAAATGRRWIERPAPYVTLPDPARADRRAPPEVPDDDLELGPLAGPAPAAKLWPVFLGQVTCDRTQDPPVCTIDSRGRVYAGVTAESIEAPSGTALLELGRSGDAAPRLALFLDGVTEPQLSVMADGAARLAGELAVEGDVVIREGALRMTPSPSHAPDPWTVSVVEVPSSDGAPAEGADAEDEAEPAGVVALRLEIPANGTLEIGSWSEDEGKFLPVLTVNTAGDGSVTVHGNLVEEDSLEKRAGVAPGLNGAAEATVSAAFLSGVASVASATASALARGAGGIFAGEIAAPSLAHALVRALADDQALAAGFLTELDVEDPKIALLRSKLSEHLGGGE